MFERCLDCTGQQRERCDQIMQTLIDDLSANTIPMILKGKAESEAAEILGPADTTELALSDYRTRMLKNHCSLQLREHEVNLAEISLNSLIRTGLMSEDMAQELRDFRNRNQP